MMDENLELAYERFHQTGPEFDGWLSNHGPMAVEALVRHGHADEVPRWIDRYRTRLEDLPDAPEPVTDRTWREALGDPRRIGDWTTYFTHQVREQPWRTVLATWWPRLLPGIAAGATHGVIRVGHAVRVLLDSDESPAACAELGHGLAYWAARAQAVPGVTVPAGLLEPSAALAAVPRIAKQEGGIVTRLEQLANLPGWTDSVAALRVPDDPAHVETRLADLVNAATLRYLTHGHGAGVMLVHAATAPNAVLRTLPALPTDMWMDSLSAAWAASAAVTSVYAPADAAPPQALPAPPTGSDPVAEVFDRVARHGDEHAIKLADTAVDVYRRTGNPDALAAAIRATQLIPG